MGLDKAQFANLYEQITQKTSMNFILGLSDSAYLRRLKNGIITFLRVLNTIKNRVNWIFAYYYNFKFRAWNDSHKSKRAGMLKWQFTIGFFGMF